MYLGWSESCERGWPVYTLADPADMLSQPLIGSLDLAQPVLAVCPLLREAQGQYKLVLLQLKHTGCQLCDWSEALLQAVGTLVKSTFSSLLWACVSGPAPGCPAPCA